MKKSLIALAALSVVAAAFGSRRARTHDVAFTYRMGAGFPGSVNRTHPVSIYPCMLSQTAGETPSEYGQPLLFKTASNTLRCITAADQSDVTPVTIAGTLVRPFPVQAGASAGAFGQQALTDTQTPVYQVPNDYMEYGRMVVKVHGAGGAALTVNSDVYVWAAASAGNHVLGCFEPAASAGNTVKVANAKYRGPSDSNGIAEIEVFPLAG